MLRISLGGLKTTIIVAMMMMLPISAVRSQPEPMSEPPDTLPDKLKIAVTLPDIASIVQAIAGEGVDIVQIMPAGADPHSYTLTAEDVQKITNANLIVYGHGGSLHFETELKAASESTPSIDFPDYQANGAVLKDFPGYPKCLHGSYESIDNARAIAVTVASWLTQNGADPSMVAGNLVEFIRELEGMRTASQQLVPAAVMAKSKWVALIPEEVYIIDNLGLEVGAVLMDEGSGTISGESLQNAEKKLRSKEFMGIVCPINEKDSKSGEIARQIASDTGAPVAYVSMLMVAAPSTFLSQLSFNAGAISIAGAQVAQKEKLAESGGSTTVIWGLVVFVLLIVIVMQNKNRYYGAAH